jgi:hypothetical protein
MYCPSVTTAWRVFMLRMTERPPILRVAENKLNMQSRTTDKGRGPPTWGLGEVGQEKISHAGIKTLTLRSCSPQASHYIM